MDHSDPLLFPDGFESLLRPFLAGIAYIHFEKIPEKGSVGKSSTDSCESLLTGNMVDLFDAKAYASQVVSSSDIAPGERASRLGECISLVDSRIRAQVSQHQNELLSQASRMAIIIFSQSVNGCSHQ